MDVNIFIALILGGGILLIVAWALFSKPRPSHGENRTENEKSRDKKPYISKFWVIDTAIGADDKTKASERPPSDMGKVGHDDCSCENSEGLCNLTLNIRRDHKTPLQINILIMDSKQSQVNTTTCSGTQIVK